MTVDAAVSGSTETQLLLVTLGSRTSVMTR